MDTSSPTIHVAFSKEIDEEFQNFLIRLNRVEAEMWRLEMAMTDTILLSSNE